MRLRQTMERVSSSNAIQAGGIAVVRLGPRASRRSALLTLLTSKPVVICRLLGGLSTAGGSVTLGVLADMWEPEDQEYAIAFLVLSSVGGSVVGAVVGGFVEQYKSLAWIFWIQLIGGGAAQLIHFFLVPETRATVILDREAKKRRRAGADPNVYGPIEIHGHQFGIKRLMTIWSRPFIMLFTEPIVAWLSAVSGFSDSLIFTFLQGFQPIYKQYNFSTIQLSLAFVPYVVLSCRDWPTANKR